MGARSCPEGGGQKEGGAAGQPMGCEDVSRRRSRRGPSPAGRSGWGLAGRESFAPGWEMLRGLRLLAGNAVQRPPVRRGGAALVSRAGRSAGGTGPNGAGGLRAGAGHLSPVGPPPPCQDKEGAGERGRATAKLPAELACPAASPLPACRCLLERAPSPWLPPGRPGRPQVCGAPSTAIVTPWYEPPRGIGSLWRDRRHRSRVPLLSPREVSAVGRRRAGVGLGSPFLGAGGGTGGGGGGAPSLPLLASRLWAGWQRESRSDCRAEGSRVPWWVLSPPGRLTRCPGKEPPRAGLLFSMAGRGPSAGVHQINRKA